MINEIFYITFLNELTNVNEFPMWKYFYFSIIFNYTIVKSLIQLFNMRFMTLYLLRKFEVLWSFTNLCLHIFEVDRVRSMSKNNYFSYYYSIVITFAVTFLHAPDDSQLPVCSLWNPHCQLPLLHRYSCMLFILFLQTV